MTIYGEWMGFIIRVSRSNYQPRVSSGRLLQSSSLFYSTYHKAVKSSVKRMGPVKEVDHLNDYMLGVREHTKFSTVASSEEGGEGRVHLSEVFHSFHLKTIRSKHDTMLIFFNSRSGPWVPAKWLSVLFCMGKKKKKDRKDNMFEG